jgi:hypothetical protein
VEKMHSEEYVVVWREGNEDHKIVGARILAEDELFFRISTANGTEIRLSKSAIIKIEKLRSGRY